MKLMEVLENIGIDWRDRKLLWNLYHGHSAYIELRKAFLLDVGLSEGSYYTFYSLIAIDRYIRTEILRIRPVIASYLA